MSITLLTVFLAEAIICTVSGEQLDRKVGGELLLTPDKSTVTDSITSILWRHGKNKVAEWDNAFGGLDIYAAFKERTTLDQTTGELRITGLMKTDSGVYSVEFNSKLLDKTYTLSVIKAVPKPTITSSCNPDKTICTLTCEGNTTDAEPVTYSWKVGERAWEVVDKQHSVSKNNTGKSNNGYKYTCKLKNPVSEEVSKPIREVFGPEPSIRDFVGVVVTAIVAFVFIVITGMLVWKKKKGYTWINILSKLFCGMCGTAGNNANSVKPGTKHEVGESKTDGSAAPVGADVSKTDGSAAPVGKDVSKTDGSAAPVGKDVSKTDGSAAPVGKDVSKTDGSAAPVGKDETKMDDSAAPVGKDETKMDDSAAPVGKDETKMDDSAAPGGDLNAAEGQANGEGFVLLNEDRVKYDNGNGEGAAEENSAL